MIDWNSIAKKFKEADAILIGASNGLSITEGLHLFADNAAFERLFGDFKQKYGLGCILQGMMAGWPSEEEKWAFWTRLIHHYCGQYQPTPVMNDLKAIVGEKDYFVVTSNGEGHFE
ncbi:MAG: NAD-dependent protein deacetylase, SIR2 family, partial [Clostridiales bacterium]|nr:NAD-dependent protein deacetylase, SIR2 family [Clostridiales bacterium]